MTRLAHQKQLDQRTEAEQKMWMLALSEQVVQQSDYTDNTLLLLVSPVNLPNIFFGQPENGFDCTGAPATFSDPAT
ncbi:hypothetical protein WJX84_010426 [Apatococcus fuscideae]|uniref:Uncharacterized protein n=1 Tax=Apatococcus fuscideae TaxID=2026836 RepID=A0AAW1TFQ9_9CHLO